MTTFLRNCWYVGAWPKEYAEGPLGRVILNEPVVFFRKQDGTPVAMADRCPHRFVPLSMGKVENDEIVCGYHALSFNSDGRCTATRACDVADQFLVKTYPVVERHGVTWIWMGESARADPAKIPDFSFFEDPACVVVAQGRTHLQSNYLLEIDNLLDLTHVDTLHANSIANVPMTTIGEYAMSREGDTIHSDWFVSGTKAPLQYHAWIAATGDPLWDGEAKENVDLWLEMHWHPASIIFLNTGIAPAGTNRAAKIEVLQGHFVTPETQSSSHYFWSFTIPELGTPQEHIDMFVELARRAFEDEDRPMLHAQQEAISGGDFWAQRPMILKEDAGAIRARRMLDKMIREQERPKDAAMPAIVELAE